MLFLDRRIHFHKADGSRHRSNSGAPVVLVAFGGRATCRLLGSSLTGVIVDTWVLKPDGGRVMRERPL